MVLLNNAWGFGSEELPAAQATLMKMIVEGIMGGQLPWILVFMGVFLALALEIVRVPVMPFAIGLYLPVQLSACIMVGGVVRLVFDKMKMKSEEERKRRTTNGTLYCAGLIAGEGIVGIVLAVFAVIQTGGGKTLADVLGELFNLTGAVGTIAALVLLGLMVFSLVAFSNRKSEKK